MSLRAKSAKKFRSFDMPVSFRMSESRERLRDALNVFSNQGRLETRHGRTRYNTEALPGSILSLSYFENAEGEKFILAKVAGSIYLVSQSDAPVEIKSGLTETTRHRGLTFARGASSRQIISIEEDGLFQFDGTNFTQLGQDPPGAPTVATTTGSVDNGSYKIGLTFYSSATGFETNIGTLSAIVTTSAQGILVSDIPATADNATIDKVRIYWKTSVSVNPPTFVTEINLGVTSYSITATPTSTQVPPTANAKPLAGGGKFMAEFNRALVYAGNDTYLNDVYFSEEDIPDAFNDGTADGRKVLYATLDGAITGLAVGLYNNSHLDPFLVVFKKRSTHIYSELGGEGKFVPISKEIGCVSHDTIQVKNGVVYFLSEQGWRTIANGQFVINEQGNPATLGGGDIDDIFRSPGYAYEVNKAQLENSFSIYYSTLDQYMTWVAEGANSDFSKTYVYEFKIGGFKPYQFNTPATAACMGQESTGEVVYMGDANGYVYTHSTSEERSDADETGEAQAIEASASMAWVDGDDLDSTFNYRELILRRLAGSGDMLARVNLDFDFESSGDYTFESPQSGFILDVSKVDIDAFGTNERSIITSRIDINRVGESIMVSFYQNAIGQNIGLVAAQLEFSKNGNRN